MNKSDTAISFFSRRARARVVWFLLLFFIVVAKGNSQQVFINDSAAMFTTGANPDCIIERINLASFHFIKVPNHRVNFGMTGCEYHYVILKVNSTHTFTGQYLSIDNTSLDTVAIYRLYNGKTARLIYRGGELVDFPVDRHHVWHTAPLEITSDPSFYLIAMKASQENINIRYEIMARDDLQNKYEMYDRFVFFYIGIVCTIMAIIALAVVLFKKAMFAAYLGYIICVSGWILSHYGRIFPFVYPHIPRINEIAKPVLSLGAVLFLILVLRLVFSQQLQSLRWLRQLIKWAPFCLLLLACFMLLLLAPDLHPQVKAALIAGWHTGLALSFFIVVFTPLYFINSSFTAKVFSCAILVISIMMVVQQISNFGNINNFFITEHGITIGNLLENSIMAFGLFYSLLAEKKQQEKRVLVLEQEQTETIKKLITLQDNERKRIANDLHDNIGPLLAALKINFRRIIHAKEGELQNGLASKTESIIDDSIAEIRNVAHNLMPKGLSSNGLINTLTGYFEGIQQLYNKTIVFHHQIQSIFHPDLQINVYRIICELVLNAARHSNACLITIGIIADKKRVSIAVCDNGQGFQSKAGEQRKSLGLQSAENRVLYLKGKFSLKSKPGKGTGIDMEIPLQYYETVVEGF